MPSLAYYYSISRPLRRAKCAGDGRGNYAQTTHVAQICSSRQENMAEKGCRGRELYGISGSAKNLIRSNCVLPFMNLIGHGADVVFAESNKKKSRHKRCSSDPENPPQMLAMTDNHRRRNGGGGTKQQRISRFNEYIHENIYFANISSCYATLLQYCYTIVTFTI